MDCSIEIPVCLNFPKPVLLITPISLFVWSISKPCKLFLSSVTDVISSLHILLKIFLRSTSNWIAVIQIYGRQRMNLRTHTYMHTHFTWIYKTRTHTKQNPCSSTALWIYELPIPCFQGETTSVFLFCLFVFCFVCL